MYEALPLDMCNPMFPARFTNEGLYVKVIALCKKIGKIHNNPGDLNTG